MRLQVLALCTASIALGCDRSSAPSSGQVRPSFDRNHETDQAVDTSTTMIDPISVVEGAVEALGGEDNFSRASMGTTTMKLEGELQPGLSGTFTKTEIFSYPGRLRRVVNGSSRDEQFDLLYVFNDVEGWVQINGLEPVEVPVHSPIVQGFPLETLNAISELKSGKFELSILPEDELNGQSVICIERRFQGSFQGCFYFDKTTKLLTATKKHALDPTTGVRRTIEIYYSDYENVEDLMIPTRMEVLTDGEVTALNEVTDVAFTRSIDDATFAKPNEDR